MKIQSIRKIVFLSVIVAVMFVYAVKGSSPPEPGQLNMHREHSSSHHSSSSSGGDSGEKPGILGGIIVKVIDVEENIFHRLIGSWIFISILLLCCLGATGYFMYLNIKGATATV